MSFGSRAQRCRRSTRSTRTAGRSWPVPCRRSSGPACGSAGCVAPTEMIRPLQSFNFGGGVSPYMSRVATYFMRDHLEEHVKLLADIYHQKRDAMLRGLREELDGDRRRRSAIRKAASSSGSSCRPAPTRPSLRSGRPRRASSGGPERPSCRMAAARSSRGWPTATSRSRSATRAGERSRRRSANRSTRFEFEVWSFERMSASRDSKPPRHTPNGPCAPTRRCSGISISAGSVRLYRETVPVARGANHFAYLWPFEEAAKATLCLLGLPDVRWRDVEDIVDRQAYWQPLAQQRPGAAAVVCVVPADPARSRRRHLL